MQFQQTTTKPHYAILDGMRGIAAIIIVIFHCYEILTPELTDNPVAHGYLAVDFFFCLSGFVIGYAYDNRVATIGVKRFLLNRLIRLQPLVILGTLLGLAGLFLDSFTTVSPVQEFGWSRILVATLGSLLLLPAPILGRYGNVFPLNAPAWSLSMEYFINLFYVFVLVHLSRRLLLVFLVAAAAFLIWVAATEGIIIGGWSAASYRDGYARVLFSFIAGLTVYRFRLVVANRIPFWTFTLLLVGIFLIPHTDRDWLVELLLVVLAFPLLIALGAGSRARGWVHRFGLALGAVSYPLYMVHYWMIWILGAYAATNPGMPALYRASGLILVAALILAWLVLKYFDEPVRKRLTIIMKQKNKSETADKS
ncbi:acyltransferase [Niabella terrae]